jgi:hypothetical protein
MDAGELQRLRGELFLPGGRIDLGLVLLGLWVFAQLSPETLLFGMGDLRDLFKSPSGKLYPVEVFLRVEAGVACANGFAAGLLAACLVERSQPARSVVLLLMATALAAHALAFGALVGPQEVFTWVTPGAIYGVAAAIALLMIAVALPRGATSPGRLRPAGRLRHRQPHTGQSLQHRRVLAVAAGAFSQLQRPDAGGLRRLAVRGDALSGPPRRRSRAREGLTRRLI